jgi:hypothetical protein
VRKTLRLLVFVVCVAFSVGAAINVMADNRVVEQMAAEVACGDQKDCKTTTTRMERTPFSQTFEIVTHKRKVDVRCSRSLVMFGDYACALR